MDFLDGEVLPDGIPPLARSKLKIVRSYHIIAYVYRGRGRRVSFS